MTLRSTRGEPPSVARGSASAAASVTAPRIPAHERTARTPLPGIRAGSLIIGRIRHWRFAAIQDQAARVAITVALTAAAHSSRSPVERSLRLSTIGRSSSPTRTKRVAFSMNVTISHTASP